MSQSSPVQDLLDAYAHPQLINRADDAAVTQAAPAVDDDDAPMPYFDDDNATSILIFTENDVLSGRGAFINANLGNIRFRSLCFTRKAEFEAGNPVAKRRIALDIVRQTKETSHARFLKRQGNAGPWVEMDIEAAQSKAQQVMRDYRRPDREERDKNAKKRRLPSAIDGLNVHPPASGVAMEPIIEVLEGVHLHDVLLGRGAFINAHLGNERLRQLALERKNLFDTGSYTEKRTLAVEILQKIRELDPPGRFLSKIADPTALTDKWEEVLDEDAIQKACQAMRDINRKDRVYRQHRKRQRQLAKEAKRQQPAEEPSLADGNAAILDSLPRHHAAADSPPAEVFYRNGLVAQAVDIALQSSARLS
ncbi:hypothetical protein MPSEU_000251000 [Mayamaea pseudoterrestris]|nr:hypothetical protein MPSEU_000251000 [Mayamaea pseudoterrestris]